MGLIGFWHGANWTFVVFGLYWGVAIALVPVRGGTPDGRAGEAAAAPYLAPVKDVLGIATMFVVVCALAGGY